MIIKEHTRNQKRMYRIHKMEEQIEKDKYIIGNQQQEIERLNNIIENFEEELEREINIKEENTGLEHNTYIDVKSTLETVLRRFRNIKGVDKE